MNNKTLVTILIVGAVAAGGYYLYKKQQEKKNAPATPQNPNQANPATPLSQDPTIADYINGGAHVLEVFREEFSNW